MHPQYLDGRGLVALWREALLAQKVLAGKTRGYRRHPQLLRFRAHSHPEAAIATYLRGILGEAEIRGYQFDGSKVATAVEAMPLDVTSGQLLFEWTHLMKKLKVRNPTAALAQSGVEMPRAHPFFRVVAGPIATWERLRI